MRILLLTILFAGTYYFFTKDPRVVTQQVDSVKIKLGAPHRDQIDRILTVDNKPSSAEESREVASEADTESEGTVSEAASTETNDLEHVEEIQLNDLEESWNNELKDMLGRLEPADGDKIHKAYMDEQESYQAELDALTNEKHQKTTEEATLEVEQLIGQLDQKHQEKLKEIFGAHYEAVTDGYERYMENASDE